jgi:hypothetical protein
MDGLIASPIETSEGFFQLAKDFAGDLFPTLSCSDATKRGFERRRFN